MFRNMRVKAKILTIVLGTLLSAVFIIAIISYHELNSLAKYSQSANVNLSETTTAISQNALLNQAESIMLKLVTTHANHINSIFTHAENELFVAARIATLFFNSAESLIKSNAEADEFLVFAPNTEVTDEVKQEIRILKSMRKQISPLVENHIFHDMYVGTQNGIFYNYAKKSPIFEAYDPRLRPWYVKTFDIYNDVSWIETYSFSDNRTDITGSIAIKGLDGKTLGAVGGDIPLDFFTNFLRRNVASGNSYAFVIDRQGNFIVHPRYHEKGFDRSPLKTATGNRAETLKAMARGETGINMVTTDGFNHYVAFAPIHVVGWSLGISIPIADVTAPAEGLRVAIANFTENAQKNIKNALSSILSTFSVLFMMCIAVFFVISIIFARTITKPLQELSQKAKLIGDGNLDTKIEVYSKDEVGDLAATFNGMSERLQRYIANLSTVIKEKEAINSELSVAANIQKDMLPKIFPTFENINGARIFAEMIPAKEVGGDFYDIFFIDEQQTKLCCIVADVSGKGIPSSLFMVIAKTILKSSLLGDGNLSESINKANVLLAEENNSCMFVTVFASILSINTGEFQYVNCGHNPPFLYTKGNSFEFMNVNSSLPLAVSEAVSYEMQTMQLNLGDIVYMYTDGINEAMNEHGEAYGDKVLRDTLNSIPQSPDLNPTMIDKFIRDDVSRFVGATEQSDDMTTLVLQYTSDINKNN